MPTYELEHGGKTVEIDSDSVLSPDQLKAYAYYATTEEKPTSPAKAAAPKGVTRDARGLVPESEIAKGLGETALTMATGIPAAAAGALAGGLTTLGKGAWRGGKALATGGDVGEELTQAAVEGGKVLEGVQQGMTYAPRTEAGQAMTRKLAVPFEMASGALGDVGKYVGGLIGPKSAAVGGALGEKAMDIAGLATGGGAIAKGLKGRGMLKPVLSQSQDAAIRATKDGYTPPPTQTNPSLPNQIMSTVANADKLSDEIAVKNATNTTRLAKEDIGLKPDQYLDAKELGAVKAAAEQKYGAVQRITDVNLAPDDGLRAALHVADKADASAAQAKRAAPEYYHTPEFERVKAEILNPQAAHTPGSMMKFIADLRNDASIMSKRAGASPKDFREAMAMRSVATSLEDFLERKLTESVYVGGDATAAAVPGGTIPGNAGRPLPAPQKPALPAPAQPGLLGERAPPGPQGEAPVGQMPMKDGGLLQEQNNAARKALIDGWKDARQTLAKVHNIEESTNLQTGHVDPAKLKKLRDAGAPLSGNLSKIVDAHEAMGDVVKSVEKGNKSALRAGDSSVGQAVLKAGHSMSAAALGAGAGGAVAGPPGALAGGAMGLAIPLAARKVMASKLYQSLMSQPSPTVMQQLKAIDPALAAKAAAAIAAANLGQNRDQLPIKLDLRGQQR